MQDHPNTNPAAESSSVSITPASPAWISALSDDLDAIDVLSQIATAGNVTGITVAVVRLSGSSNDEVRRWAAESLESSIIPAVGEVDELAELLYAGHDGEVCYWAATMLGRLGSDVGPRARAAVNALETCLSDSLYLPARERSAWALSQIGPPAASAATTLRRTAEDAPPRLKKLVTKALRVIGEAA